MAKLHKLAAPTALFSRTIDLQVVCASEKDRDDTPCSAQAWQVWCSGPQTKTRACKIAAVWSVSEVLVSRLEVELQRRRTARWRTRISACKDDGDQLDSQSLLGSREFNISHVLITRAIAASSNVAHELQVDCTEETGSDSGRELELPPVRIHRAFEIYASRVRLRSCTERN